MSIEQAITSLAARVRELKPIIETEEATKTALIIPFISNVLGYDVTDPREVIPEYTADIGVKKGEKVDFAIKTGDDFHFLIECKKVGSPLSLDHANQLVRYFNVTDTEFAILTNGEVYQFYGQLDAANRMDEKPFMTLDLNNIDARQFPHLEMCTRKHFNPQALAANAEELKYIAELKKVIANQFQEPDAEIVKMLAATVTTKRMTAQNLEFFTRLVNTASSQFLKDEVNRRLRSAQVFDDPVQAQEAQSESTTDEETIDEVISDIVTTEEEIHGHSIVRAICCSEVPAQEITMRDAKSYCAILFQDNNRKPIARFYFDRKIPRIGIFNPDGEQEQFDLESIEDIYNHADLLRSRVAALNA
ncbi:type IV restriction endonuclease [Corynebacterium suranareeae]|uniref:Type IV restriction endonuclease n=1 Tax=Corynebacterium suranareeae TaxID=2506452 RepID=A0A160PRD7_9CORY|nr:type I restriction enzyme HsdR N-terminal domain-containing protein [Corynebacterium suranareeae]BAU96767.1 type IV restriction endonuclease [Corynebacterium suranareeae]